MSKSTKSLNIYFVIIGLLLLLTIWISTLNSEEETYTYDDFLIDLDNGQITEAIIQPNQETPTGAVAVTLVSEEEKIFYVADTEKIEQLLRDNKIDITRRDIPKDSWFMTYMLPVVIVLIVVVFFFVIMNTQNAGGGGGGSKMMNFGKSRAKLSVGDNKVTLKDVLDVPAAFDALHPSEALRAVFGSITRILAE